LELPENVKILTGFILVFSIAIAWFKDLPDIEGDSKYNIKTLAVLYSPKASLIAGTLLVGFAYIFTICIKFFDLYSSENASPQTQVLLYGHIILFVFFIINTFSVKLDEHQSIKKFYKRFWWFFFAEYAIYLAAYLA
ncbi:MAG TPA: UbiA family prenyltransferase, partial [Bacteroidia bacterium]|nr:UbiA family prenyltransferase [Bacteroidia bacterium]